MCGLVPCENSPEIAGQVEPTVDLLVHLDETHPDVLESAGISPAHYHAGHVFRSAVETIRGQQAARQKSPRELFVAGILTRMREAHHIVSFEHTRPGVRWDFDLVLDKSPERRAAIEVKGGEGNSLNISNRPPGVAEFLIWCHIDGSIKNSPSAGVRSIVSRIVADIVKAPKQIDALIVRDRLCGTSARPCPKYTGQEPPHLGPAPDIFLFPAGVPLFGGNEHPPVNTSASCVLPFRLLDLFGVPNDQRDSHVHSVDIRLFYRDGRPMREVAVSQEGVEQFRNVAEVRVRR